MAGNENLRIVHCVRSTVGGIFRHLSDLATAQAAAGHQVGLICDSSTGGSFEDAAIERLRPSLALGCVRLPMKRQIGPWDIAPTWKIYRHLRALDPDVLHAHGAKGGAYMRIVGTALNWLGAPVARFYCPHGGSLHYDPKSLKGRLVLTLERQLAKLTDGFIFVSEYERNAFFQKVGTPPCPSYLVPNGLRPGEFLPVETRPDAVDFLFIGMLRDLKGPDVFIDAIADLHKRGQTGVTAHVVGDGPDRDAYKSKVHALGLDHAIKFFDPMPARDAFARARVVVVPSRAESMPYIVLEVLAAGKPLIATNVGGIPEIYADASRSLIAPGQAERLADAMAEAISHPERMESDAAELRASVKGRFSLVHMANAVEKAYRNAVSAVPSANPGEVRKLPEIDRSTPRTGDGHGTSVRNTTIKQATRDMAQ